MRQDTFVALLGLTLSLLCATSVPAQAPAGRQPAADLPPSLAPTDRNEIASPSDLVPPAPPAAASPAANSLSPAPAAPPTHAPGYPAHSAGCAPCYSYQPCYPCQPRSCCYPARCGRRAHGCYSATACYVYAPSGCCGSPAISAAPGYYPAAWVAPAVWRYR